jgi:hypothetical protein
MATIDGKQYFLGGKSEKKIVSPIGNYRFDPDVGRFTTFGLRRTISHTSPITGTISRTSPITGTIPCPYTNATTR